MQDKRKSKEQLLKKIEELEQSSLALLEQNAASPTEEAKLRAFVNGSPDVMLVMDEKGTYVEVLTSKNELLQLKPEDLIGKNAYEVMSKDEADAFLKIIKSWSIFRTVRHGCAMMKNVR
ncbi:MAG: PAS domain S-box protein [Chloroflexi bacterium]|nr:PAS domain S-box protein [Chloroflexota bacterium]